MKILALLLVLASPLAANTDVRQWISGDRTFAAELVNYNPETKAVIFKGVDGVDFEMASVDLSMTDQAWLKEWTFLAERMAGKLEEIGGKVEHHLTKGKHPTDLFIFHPPEVSEQAARPMLILFHPSGKAQRYLLRFVEAAAELKLVVVSCGTFRNTGHGMEDLEKEEDLLDRFREILPQIESRVAHDPKRMMMGGSSGGAWRAFHYSAWVDRPWCGIFSNGGWLGRERYWNLAYPAMRVAIVNGNKDHANLVVEHDTGILTKRGCTVAAFSFEGGHQDAPAAHTTDALRWILEGRQQAK